MIFNVQDETVSAVIQIVSLSFGITVSVVFALLSCAGCHIYTKGKPRNERTASSKVKYSVGETPQRLSTDGNLKLTSVNQRQSVSAIKQANTEHRLQDAESSSHEVMRSISEPNDSCAIYSELDTPYSRLDEVNGHGNKISPTPAGSGPMLPPRSPNRSSNGNYETRKSVLNSSASFGSTSGGDINGESPCNDTEHPTEPGYSGIKLPPFRHSCIPTQIDNDSNYSEIPDDRASTTLDNGGLGVARGPQDSLGDKPKYAVVNKARKTEDFSYLYSPIIKPSTNTGVMPLLTATVDSQSSIRHPSGNPQDFGYASVKDFGLTLPNDSQMASIKPEEPQRAVPHNIYENPDEMLRHGS